MSNPLIQFKSKSPVFLTDVNEMKCTDSSIKFRYCNGKKHCTYECNAFKKLKVNDRWEWAKSFACFQCPKENVPRCK